MPPCPVPKPRRFQQTPPSHQPSPPSAKPRTVHLTSLSVPEEESPPAPEEAPKADPDSRPKQSLRKLQLTDEEKTQLVNLHSFSADSDSETHGGSSSCSSSSANAGPPKTEGLDGQEEEGYWSGSTAGHMREKRNRRCFKRKEMPSGPSNRVRSKFSPWNLSSPRISRDARLSVHVNQPGRVGKLETHPPPGLGLIWAHCNTHSHVSPQKRHSDITVPRRRAWKEMMTMTTTMMIQCLNKTSTCLRTK